MRGYNPAITTYLNFDIDNLTLNDQADFESYIGDILVSIIEEKTDESGANDTKQPDL